MLAVPADNINLSPVPPAIPTLGKPTLVLLLVDIVPNQTVVPDNVDMPVIYPAICKFVADNVLVVLFHTKFGDGIIDVVALPINI
jgi:hypothetical protein